MVIKCDQPFSENEQYNCYFSLYDKLELSNFQKWSFKAIVDKQHILITAATGSGKTLPAEFAIQYFIEKGKKVIYTTPIKALSNTKLSDLRNKYPHISFGIITGDVTDNPDADVLIMTTEILTNTLFNQELNASALSFDIDIENDLAAVVFDEVHYINDEDRGSIWEQAIIKLPPQVQLIMLSATINKPEMFASWIEIEKSKQSSLLEQEHKQVYLAPSSHRIVPLTHYIWLTTHKSTFKTAKGTEYEGKLNSLMNKPILLNDHNNQYNTTNTNNVNDIIRYFKKNRIYVKRQFALDTLIRHLKKTNGLPAICFVFSRKNVEYAAKEIGFSLLENDSEIPLIIEKECRNILAKKLTNYKEYLELPEYHELLELFKKGIAIHHAGILAVFREMIEMLFEKKYIKLLFATETLAVGVNFSTTSVIFTGIEKYNGTTMRILYPHEYTQMAGRAGRRGIDKVGKVWLCANLFHNFEPSELKHMITGPPQTLVSKFKISYPLTLNIIENNENIVNFVSQSLMKTDINKSVKSYDNGIAELETNIQKCETMLKMERTPKDIIIKYTDSQKKLSSGSNKQRKKTQRELSNLEETHKFLKDDIKIFNEINKLKSLIITHNSCKTNAKNHIHYLVEQTVGLLLSKKIIEKNEDNSLSITERGKIASLFKEIHPLMITDIIHDTNYFHDFSVEEIAAFFACFANVNVSDDIKAHNPISASQKLNELTTTMNKLLDEYYDLEVQYDINTGSNYERNFDIQQYIINWCNAADEELCKGVLNDMKSDTGIFLGEFIKAILKINNIAVEVEKAAELMQNLELVEKMRKIPAITLKYVATNQSLYI
jgi:superfamily II RNA helicase